MPPAVAQNRSGSESGVTVWVPVGVTRVIERTWEQKLPSTWWFFPWMSAAIAPPTVTRRVPGVTGTNQPSGTNRSMRVSRLTPAPTVIRPASRSTAWTASSQVASSDGAAGVLRGVAVAAAQAAGHETATTAADRDARRRDGHGLVDDGRVDGVDDVGRRRGGTAPAGQQGPTGPGRAHPAYAPMANRAAQQTP